MNVKSAELRTVSLGLLFHVTVSFINLGEVVRSGEVPMSYALCSHRGNGATTFSQVERNQSYPV